MKITLSQIFFVSFFWSFQNTNFSLLAKNHKAVSTALFQALSVFLDIAVFFSLTSDWFLRRWWVPGATLHRVKPRYSPQTLCFFIFDVIFWCNLFCFYFPPVLSKYSFWACASSRLSSSTRKKEYEINLHNNSFWEDCSLMSKGYCQR